MSATHDVRQREAANDFEPTEHYRAWRSAGRPLHHEADHDPPFYVLHRFDDVFQAVRTPELWTNADGPGVFYQESGVLGTADDPDHHRHRQVLRAAFTPRAVARLEGRIRAIADELINRFIDDGRCEFVAAFAAPLPALAIADLLGVPTADRERFQHLTDIAVAALSGGDIDAYTSAKAEIECFIHDGIAVRRRSLSHSTGEDAAGSPGPDDVLSLLALARHDDVIDDDEAGHLGYQLLVAGHETTAGLLGTMLFRLLERPAVMARLREDHSLLPSAIEEALRFDSPVHGLFRTNSRRCTVHETEIERGTKLQLAFAAANRDPDVFTDPDEFIADRAPDELRRHLAFGWGTHFCLGAHLARLEARVAFEQLFARTQGIELAGTPKRNDSFVLHNLVELPIRFVAR